MVSHSWAQALGCRVLSEAGEELGVSVWEGLGPGHRAGEGEPSMQ